jgi:hypothetical protein
MIPKWNDGWPMYIAASPIVVIVCALIARSIAGI